MTMLSVEEMVYREMNEKMKERERERETNIPGNKSRMPGRG